MRRCLPIALLTLLLGPGSALGRDVEGPTGAAPARNFSNIHAEVDWVQKAFAEAEAAAAEGDWGPAVRALQGIVDQRASRESPQDAAPYVRAVFGSSVYEGAWLVARHRIARGGAAALTAYEREYGATAGSLLRAAVAQRDPRLLHEVASRFLPLRAARQAALLSIDLALERADRDGALAWLEALEDLEAVSTETAESLAPWRAARIERQARVMARSAEVRPQVAAALEAADPADGLGVDPVAIALRRLPAPPTAWTTSGGNAARAAVPAALGSRFRLRWFRPPSPDDDLTDVADPARLEHDRPSLWLPPRAAATRDHVFVSDGQYLHIYDLDSGARVFDRDVTEYPGMRAGGLGEDGRHDRRLRFGLLEGHTLTVEPIAGLARPAAGGPQELGAGHLVLAAVPDSRPWAWDREDGPDGPVQRDDHIQAYHWDGERLAFLWRAGGATLGPDSPGALAYRGGLRNDTRLYGAPLLYGGRVWVAGVRPAHATPDRWEAWLFSFDPGSGRVATRTHLGTGTPMRTGRTDEVIPSSPAAERGRVVVSTSLGILAAVDAHDGRVQWIHRYDRNVETERGRRRNRDSRDRGLRTSGFFNEPPILALGRCYVTPTDGNLVLSLYNRPRGRGRALVAQDPDRYFFGSDFMVEHLAGVVAAPDGATALVGIGKGESGSPPGPLVVVRDALTGDMAWPGRVRSPRGGEPWKGRSPTGFGAEPYGRALVTAAEVFVPQQHGIAVFQLFDSDGDGSHFLGILDRGSMDAETARTAPPRPYGNLIAIPGRGVLAVSATTVAFWERR